MADSDSGSYSSSLRFTSAELEVLGRTADALTAWMGKPVLAQVVDSIETGYEWALFAIPLQPEQDASDITVVQVGGPHARLIGNKGGLSIADGDIYDCEYLWAVQLSDIEGVRFIKIDAEGEEVAWTNDLSEIVPFDLSEVHQDDLDISDDPDDDQDDEDDDPDDDFRDVSRVNRPGGNPTLH